MDKTALVKEIIKEQSLIMGEDIAINRAEATGVLKCPSNNIDEIQIIDENNIIEKVTQSFAEVFGNASVKVCKEVIRRFGVDSLQLT